MGVTERKGRERAERERRIKAAARDIADREGWGAVTIRRLAEEIEYSQPVLYAHFENRDAIVAAVAVEGFEDLTTAIRQAADPKADRRTALRNAADAYLGFTFDHPALYEAMFTMPTGLRFADADTKPELKAAFAALAAFVSLPGRDNDAATETFWASLHGLAELERAGRIRRSARDQRLALLVDAFS
jgi:AcrR family transcriptional regulator